LQEVRIASREMQSLPKRLSRASKAQAEAGREVSSAGGHILVVTLPLGFAIRIGKNGFIAACCRGQSALACIKIHCSEILEFAPIVSYWL